MNLARVLLAVVLSTPLASTRAYDPPRPTAEEALTAASVAFVGRVTEAREVARGDGTDARASLQVECCLVGAFCARDRLEITYRARGGVDERDMAVGLAPGQRYLFVLRSAPRRARFRLNTYASNSFVFEFDTSPEYLDDRTTVVRATLTWFDARTEALTVEDVISAAMKNPAHAAPPLCVSPVRSEASKHGR